MKIYQAQMDLGHAMTQGIWKLVSGPTWSSDDPNTSGDVRTISFAFAQEDNPYVFQGDFFAALDTDTRQFGPEFSYVLTED